MIELADEEIHQRAETFTMAQVDLQLFGVADLGILAGDLVRRF
jgi:hypothetical protein